MNLVRHIAHDLKYLAITPKESHLWPLTIFQDVRKTTNCGKKRTLASHLLHYVHIFAKIQEMCAMLLNQDFNKQNCIIFTSVHLRFKQFIKDARIKCTQLPQKTIYQA